MRRSLLLMPSAALTTALSLGCATEPTSSRLEGIPGAAPQVAAERTGVDRLTRREPWEDDITNPCTGAVIHFVGEIKEQRVAVGPQELLDQGLALHTEDHTLLTGTGTDPVSGATYSIRFVINFGFNSPTLEALNITLRDQTMVRGVTTGSGENFLVRFIVHVTVLPSGEVASEFVIDSAECRG